MQRARWGLIVLAAALAGCHDAPHERFVAPWKRFLVGIDMAGGLDTSRMNLRDGEAHVWLRFQYSQPQSIGNPPTHYAVVEVRESVRCPTHEARNERMLIRDAQNDSVGGMTIPDQHWQSFAATGFTDRVFIPLCHALGAD